MSRKPRPAPRPIDTPWMTPAETCLYLRWVDAEGKPNLNQFYCARSQHGLPASKAAGALRCHKQFVDEWVRTGEPVFDSSQRGFKTKAAAAEQASGAFDAFCQPAQFVSR